MVDWTTVVISIGASLIGGLLSGTWQVNRSIKKQREERREREKENWFHQINSICLRIHREVLRLPPNEPIVVNGYKPESDSNEIDLKTLNLLMDDLLEAHTEAPSEISRDLLNEIEALGFEYENIEPAMGNPTTTDLKDLLKKEVENIMNSATEQSDKYDDPPY